MHVLELLMQGNEVMTKDIYTTIAKQLRLKRLNAGMTIEELAASANISTSFLAYLETNKKKPSLVTIAKLAKALDVPVAELFNEPVTPIGMPENFKHLRQIYKLLHNQTQADTEIIIATLTALAKSLHKQK